MARFFITGGAGFIGSHVVDECVRHGHDVVVFDNFTTGSRENLHEVLDRIEIVKGDIRDEGAVLRAAVGADFISHHAAVGLVGPTVDDPLYADAVNIHGFVNVLQAARKSGVKRVVNASSAAVYGQAEGIIRRENMQLMPESPYAVTKVAGEYYCRVFYSLYGLETVSLRYFNVYGPRQSNNSHYSSVVPIFVQRVLSGRTVTIHGDGSQRRDFIFVKDVVRANIMAAASNTLQLGKAYNVGSGTSHTIQEVFDEVQRVAARRVDVAYEPRRKGDLDQSEADLSQARTHFGFEPTVHLNVGLRELITWHKSRARESVL